MLERKYTVHQRLCLCAGEQFQNLRPYGAPVRVCISGDRYPADPDATEDQRSGIELWHRSGQSAHDADLAEVAESVEELREKLDADVVDRQVDTARGECLF